MYNKMNNKQSQLQYKCSQNCIKGLSTYMFYMLQIISILHGWEVQMEKFQPEGDCFVGNEAYAEFPPKQSPEGWNFSICTDNKPCKILFLAYLPFPFYILCYLRWNKSSIFVQYANI